MPLLPILAFILHPFFLSSYSAGQKIADGDAISLIRRDRNCRIRDDLDAAPEGTRNIILDARGSAAFDFTDVPPAQGYKLCVCPAAAITTENGIKSCPDGVAATDETQITVQDTMSGINFKGIVAGSSVRHCFLCACPLFVTLVAAARTNCRVPTPIESS